MSASFFPDTTKLSHANALRLGEAAALAYRTRKAIDEQTRLWGMQSKFIQDKTTDTQAFVAWDVEAVFVAFRGTETQKVQDIAVDAAAVFAKGPFAKSRIHAGFGTSLAAVWDRVVAAVTAAQTGGQSLWLTGHSLGGALAALAAARFCSAKKPVWGLYTFGQPRVGDDAFADTFNQRMRGRSFRYVNHSDIVPRVPPRVVGYADTDECMYFNASGDLKTGTAEWYRLLDTITIDVKALGPMALSTVADHAMDRYLVNLRRAVRSGDAPQGSDLLDLLRRLAGGGN